MIFPCLTHPPTHSLTLTLTHFVCTGANGGGGWNWWQAKNIAAAEGMDQAWEPVEEKCLKQSVSPNGWWTRVTGHMIQRAAGEAQVCSRAQARPARHRSARSCGCRLPPLCVVEVLSKPEQNGQNGQSNR